MINQINTIIGETSPQTLGEIYTGIFYSCFATHYVPGFSQSKNVFQLSKISGNTRIEFRTNITSEADEGLPDLLTDSVKFYDLIGFVDGDALPAKISSTVKFNVLAKDFLEVDRWLSSLSKISIAINICASFCFDKGVEETYSVENLKIVEGYQVDGLPVLEMGGGLAIDVVAKTPISITVTISDWIVEALSKNYLKLNVTRKLLSNKMSLPICSGSYL